MALIEQLRTAEFPIDQSASSIAARARRFSSLVLVVIGFLSLTLVSVVIRGNWKVEDSVIYGGSGLIAVCCLLLNGARRIELSVAVGCVGATVVHFIYIQAVGDAYPSSLAAMVLLGVYFCFVTRRRHVAFFAIFQLTCADIAIFLGDVTFTEPWSSWTRIIIFSASYCMLFTVLWILTSQMQAYFRKSRDSIHQLEIEQVRLRNAYEDMEQFAFVVAHDLKNPLQIVSSYAELLAHEFRDSENSNIAEYTQQIDAAIETQARMIRDLLSYARIDSPDQAHSSQFQFLDVAKPVRDDLLLLHPNAVVELTGDCALNVSETHLRMLLQNLIENGLKYNRSEKRRVKVDVSQTASGEKLIRVSDNGIGVSEAQIPRLFQLFARLHKDQPAEGSGIGLAHCKKIVETHMNGSIHVESLEGAGTTFSILLPAEPGSATEP